MVPKKIVAMAALVGATAFVGCRTMEDVKRDYNYNITVGNYSSAVPEVTELAEEKDGDELMWRLMSGSAHRLTGDAPGSVVQFDRAEDIMIEQANTSVFSKAAAGSWAMLTNDKAFDYAGGGQDRVFTCLYKAIDYMTSGKSDSARTEFNRASQHQENWLYERRKEIASANERMEKDIKEYQKEKNESNTGSADSKAAVSKAFADSNFASQIREKCGFDVKTSGVLDNMQPVDWMNPYVSHVTGVFRWLNGDDARNHLRDAATCNNNSAAVLRDFTECDKGVRPQNQVWIWVEDGLCSEKLEWRLDLPMFLIPYANRYILYAGMALPYLQSRPSAADNWSVSGANGGIAMTQIADIDKLLKIEYDVYMRGALTREITRVIIKAGTQVAAGIVADQADDWRVQLALKATQVAIAGWAAAVTSADTRSWTALPKRVHAVRVDRPADGKLLISASCGNIAEVTVPEGNSMVFVSKPGLVARAVVKTVTYP